MFEALREAIETTEVPAHADAIVELRRLRDALDSRLTEAEATYARASQYEADGFGSMAAFLRHRGRASTAEARREVRRAARLGAWPEVSRPGRRAPSPAPRSRSWRGRSPSATSTASPSPRPRPARSWRRSRPTTPGRRSSAGSSAPTTWPSARRRGRHRGSGRSSASESSGCRGPRATSGVLKGELDKDATAITEHALRLATRPDAEGERRSPAQRRADALVAVAQHYIDTHTAVTGNRRQERLGVSCDIVTLYGSALRGAGVRTAAELQAFLDSGPTSAPSRNRPRSRAPRLGRSSRKAVRSAAVRTPAPRSALP